MNKKLRDSSWARIKNCINTYNVGDILKRQTLFKQIKGVPKSSIDGYRARLQTLGILESAGRGKYRLLQKIPDELNTVVLFDLIIDQGRQPWKKWFMPLDDRMERYFNRYK